MARVELAEAALADLDRLILTHSLPKVTRRRLRRSLDSLRLFPRIGPELRGRWSDYRFVLGPWRWMLVVYAYFESEDRLVVVTIQDARASASATGSR
jgi:plasmid stabilization system protein ParE